MTKATRSTIATPSNMEKQPADSFAICTVCYEQVSANPSDYFMLAPTKTLKHCGRSMVLARSITDFIFNS